MLKKKNTLIFLNLSPNIDIKFYPPPIIYISEYFKKLYASTCFSIYHQAKARISWTANKEGAWLYYKGYIELGCKEV